MTRVAVLGTGIMGAGMARSLARAGLSVSAWNRHAEKAQALAADGISVAEKPEDAVAGAAVVVTMLFDAASVAEVMGRALPVLPEGAVWAQTSTVGPDGTAELAELARAHGVGFVDAPVLGTRQPPSRAHRSGSLPQRCRVSRSPSSTALSVTTLPLMLIGSLQLGRSPVRREEAVVSEIGAERPIGVRVQHRAADPRRRDSV